VLLLEAGGDPKQLSGGDPAYPKENRIPDDYDVPCFHPFASENDAMKWDFYVQHYKDPELQKKDSKYVQTPDGPRILYPRAGTLGGCTAHNAQVTIYPHNKDWEHIAEITGDRSWSPKNMRKYFQRLENCHHRGLWRWLYNLTRINPTGIAAGLPRFFTATSCLSGMPNDRAVVAGIGGIKIADHRVGNSGTEIADLGSRFARA